MATRFRTAIIPDRGGRRRRQYLGRAGRGDDDRRLAEDDRVPEPLNTLAPQIDMILFIPFRPRGITAHNGHAARG